MSLPSIAEVYARWHNPNCGFELEPDRNSGSPQTSENGILYHATFLMLLDMLDKMSPMSSVYFIENVCHLQTSTSGVFDRGARDSDNLDYKIRNENSQDNYIAIVCGSILEGGFASSGTRTAIALHGKKNFFIYNNVKPRISLPMNPGNWSILLSSGHSTTFLENLFFPFLVINFFITNFVVSYWEQLRGKPQSTSNKILYLLALYSLKNRSFAYKALYNIFVRRMRKLFGEFFVEELMKIYYTNPGHPNRLYSAGIKLEEL